MKIDIVNLSGERIQASRLCRDARAAFRILGAKKTPRSLVIACLRPQESARLKRQYLGSRDGANVLSFRYDDSNAEVILTPSVIEAEAHRNGIPVTQAIRGMLVHGLLHVAGYHHEEGRGRERRFEAIEQRIFSKLRIGHSHS